MARRVCVLATLVAAMVILTGCGGGATSSVDPQRSRIRSVVTLYNYAASTVGRPPANEQEFKEFITKHGAATMEDKQIKSVDELLTSERDGKPFVVMYGPRPQGESRDIVAYEQEGVDGKRLVGFSLGNVDLMDEAELRKLVPAETGSP